MTMRMQHSAFDHVTESITRNCWPRRWLMVAVLSLALAGVFAIVLVVSRTPQLIRMVPELGELFQVSLVIHVDLSVLVWFLAGAGMLWSVLRSASANPALPFFNVAGWSCMLAGMALMALSPLTGEWEVIKSNYIPVMTNLVFFIGLALVMASMVIAIIQTLGTPPVMSDSARHDGHVAAHVIRWGIYGSVLTTAIALGAFVASHELMPVTLTGEAYYETVFWAGGHVLQFTYIQIMLVAWCLMASRLGYRLPASPMLVVLMVIGPFFASLSFIPYLLVDVTDPLHMDFFTLQMNVGAGIAGCVLGLYFLYGILRAESTPREARAIKGCLLMSLMLFAFGGLFGAVINGPNVRIPAHYHGSTVAVTLALMGMAYALLPRLGGREAAGWRMARWQPYVLGVGQLIHITGLAWSGGYGVLRKTVGHTGDGSAEVKIALGMLGGGGLLAIIGGLLFVIVMVRGFRRPVIST